MSYTEKPQLPLDYVHRVNSFTFLLASLDGLSYEANGIQGFDALHTTSFYLLVALALLWGTPGTVWYRPGCWLQPLSGRNLVFCGPSAVLRRFRQSAARLGLCLTESFSRGGGTEAITLQSYWALPNSIAMDMAQLGLLSFSMSAEYLLSFVGSFPGGFRPRVEGEGSTHYITTLLGLTSDDPRFYLALRRRNFDIWGQCHRVRPVVMECLSILPVAIRNGFNTREGNDPLSRLLCGFLGLAQEDCRRITASDGVSAYLSDVLEQDRQMGDKSLFQMDLEYLDDMELLAMDDIDEDEPDIGDVF